MAGKKQTLTELKAKIEAKWRFAQEDGVTLDGAKTYEAFLTDLLNLELSAAPLDRVYTTEQVAERLQVTAQTVTEYCRAGRFDAPPGATYPGTYRTNGDSGPWRIPAAALVAFIHAQGKAAAPSPAPEDALDCFDTYLKAG